MKKSYILIAGVALLAALSSCQQLGEFKSYPFVRIENSGSAITVNEDNGDIIIPVTSYDAEGKSGSVAFTVTNVSGEASNYSVEPASGVLNFTGNGTQNITVKVVNNAGVYTGNTALKIELTSVTGELTLGAPRVQNITILDNDIPVTWDFVCDEWDAQDYDQGAEDGSPYKVTIEKVDDTTVTINNLWGGELPLVGTISFDEAANTATISIPAKQTVFDATAYGYGELWLIGVDGNGDWAWAPVIATVTSGGISIGPWNLVITAGEYAGYLYGNSYQTELTK